MDLAAEGLGRTAAGQARGCPVMVQAAQLAGWAVRQRCAVTPSGALRPGEVPAAARELGVTGVKKVRRAADVEAVHWAWTAARACGLVTEASGVAVAGELAASWPGDDAQVLAAWLAAFRAVCLDRSNRDRPESVLWLSMVALEVLDDEPALAGVERGSVPHQAYSVVHDDDFLYDRVDGSRIFDWLIARPGERSAPLFGVLEALGALAGGPDQPQVTELGRWARLRLRAEVPEQVRPDWPARELLERLAVLDDPMQMWRTSAGWLAARPPVEAARDLLRTADEAGAAHRVAAISLVDLLGDDALPALRELAGAPGVGPHLRAMTAWALGKEPDPADARWLMTEQALAGLAVSGPDEALCRLVDGCPDPEPREAVARVRASGHPDADALADALTEFIDSGRPRSVDQVVQLKVTLQGWRPSLWRRVQMPALSTLGDLHRVVQAVFGWDGDHLHVFELGNHRYTDPFFPLEECSDEDVLRMRDLVRSDGKLVYTYDLGATWRHEIAVERVIPRVAGQAYPTCVAFAGDDPVEYPEWDDESGEEPETTRPFDLAAVNARLKRLSGVHK